MSDREQKLRDLFKDVPEAQKEIAFSIISDCVFYEEQIAQLKKLPMIIVDKNNPTKQKATPGQKLIKEFSQTLTNNRKLLLMILYRSAAGTNETNTLEELLKGFE